MTVELVGNTTIEPLYTDEQHNRATTLPGTGDHRRGATAASTRAGWDIRQQHDAHRDDVNDRILHALERGATSIALINVPSEMSELERVLDGVLLDMAGIHLEGRNPMALVELWRSRDLGQLPIGSLGVDPIGRLAVTGSLPTDFDTALHNMSEVAYEVTDMPMVIPIRVDGRPYGQAGADAPTEIACMLSTAVAYLGKMIEEGRTVDEAVHDLSFSMTVDTDQFTSIAKLRAARVCWARVVEKCGGAERGMRIHAQTSASMLTVVDPWVNILRTTIATFAAAAGGAKAITVTPFDAAVGDPDDLGLRIARNIQLVLAEESALASVIDPAGGSYFVESLTDQLATRAWARFQQLEKSGGIAKALLGGTLQADIAAMVKAAESQVARRKLPITGVTEFPHLDEEALERRTPLAIDDKPESGETCDPLLQFRPSAPFEALREAAADDPLTVFSANLGAIASHTARAAFASNLFAVGGIETTTNDGFDTTDALAKAFEASGCRLVVICGSDAQYADLAAETAAAMKAAGAGHVFLAGAPGDSESAYREAGIDDFIHVGVDILDVLLRTHNNRGARR